VKAVGNRVLKSLFGLKGELSERKQEQDADSHLIRRSRSCTLQELSLTLQYSNQGGQDKRGTSKTRNEYTILIEVLIKKKVKISLLPAVEAPRVARVRGSHIT
jgi:hypothetical protein